jgi:hypothetical protein
MKGVGEVLVILMALGSATVLGWYLVKFGFSHVYDPLICEHGIRFLLFGRFIFFELRFDRIEQVYDRKTFMASHGIATSMFGVFPIVNRIARYPSPIVVQTKFGFIKYLSLTPAHPEAFLIELNMILSKGGENQLR